jgi:hypothetical protein
MSDDLLLRAVRALRESRQGASLRTASTRTRILHSARLQRRRRQRTALVLVPLAATFALSTAWAAATGRLPALLARFQRAPPAVEHPPVAGFHASSHEEADTAAPVLAAQDPANDAPTAPQTASPALSRPQAQSAPQALATLPSRHVTRPTPTKEPTDAMASATSNAEESLYAEAHTAHFVAHDAPAALRAWDTYLAAYPSGRLALEARYNRALTLVRLGRVAEARTALAPFAQGPIGGYRQSEARALLDALDARP